MKNNKRKLKLARLIKDNYNVNKQFMYLMYLLFMTVAVLFQNYGFTKETNNLIVIGILSFIFVILFILNKAVNDNIYVLEHKLNKLLNQKEEN